MARVFTDSRGYSLDSATNTATGSPVDLRSKKDVYTYGFVTGGSALISLEASHSIKDDADWKPIVLVTAVDGASVTAVYSTFWPYLRGFSSGYAGATASFFIAAGVG